MEFSGFAWVARRDGVHVGTRLSQRAHRFFAPRSPAHRQRLPTSTRPGRTLRRVQTLCAPPFLPRCVPVKTKRRINPSSALKQCPCIPSGDGAADGVHRQGRHHHHAQHAHHHPRGRQPCVRTVRRGLRLLRRRRRQGCRRRGQRDGLQGCAGQSLGPQLTTRVDASHPRRPQLRPAANAQREHQPARGELLVAADAHT
jgi:hypothetical protein